MSFHYGPTRNWIQALRVVLPDASVLSLRRGEQLADGRSFRVETEDGRRVEGVLPSYSMPDVKSAAGYFVTDNMDLIDLFIGMEGTLGIITEIELRLVKKPMALLGLTAFLPSEEAAVSFVRRTRESEGDPVAIEFFNDKALNLLRNAKETRPGFNELPELSPRHQAAVYIEFHGEDDDALEEQIMLLAETVVELGGSEDDCWCATTEREMEKLRAFRHATPELVNLLVDERKKACPELTKLGTDMSVPDTELDNVMNLYRNGLDNSSLEYVIFGHIGDNHVHVNIIPRNMAEYATGKTLYLGWAKEIVDMGGSVSAEHGIGKIKVPFLELMYGEDGIAEMKNLKAQFDPTNMLNRGDLF